MTSDSKGLSFRPGLLRVGEKSDIWSLEVVETDTQPLPSSETEPNGRLALISSISSFT